MEDQEKQSGTDDLFVKGFNYGYLLNKYEPDLLAKLLSKSRLESEFHEGLEAGRKLQEIEREKNQVKMQDRDRNI